MNRDPDADLPRSADRLPAERKLDAIEPLAIMPLFFKLDGRNVVVCGEGDAVAWKAELLAAAGARVKVLTAAPGDKLLSVAARHDAVAIETRGWRPEDLNGLALAVLDAVDEGEAKQFAAAAKASGTPVNVVDRPEHCDFSFGSIVNRSPLVIGVSTDGAAPVLGQAVRVRIEAILPSVLAEWVRAAKAWRSAIARFDLTFRQRRNLWERFADLAFRGGGSPNNDKVLDRLLADALQQAQTPAKGKIILVGAGPGDPELLTLKAVRALQSADVVLFDDLAPDGALSLARREAQRISVGKRGHAPSVGQQDISSLLVDLGLQGKVVVRLKGGDPLVFGRANEELAAARAAGLECVIVPGVTAALAAAASLGTSLSERERARRIQFITAHAADGSLPKDMDWRALVDRDASTAVYMGVKTLPALVEQLLKEGLDPSTPAALVESATLPEARVIRAAIADMPERVAAASPQGPCMLLYGQTLDRALVAPSGA